MSFMPQIVHRFQTEEDDLYSTAEQQNNGMDITYKSRIQYFSATNANRLDPTQPTGMTYDCRPD